MVCKKEYGNIGRNSSITYGKYGFSRNYEGEWNAELHIETTGIPAELFDKIKVRFGVSLKINLKDESKKDIPEIYQEVYENTKSVNKAVEKQIQLEPVRERQIVLEVPRMAQRPQLMTTFP